EANSVVEVQDLVTAGNTALAKIENYNGTTALNVEDYAAAGITGVTTDNLAAVNAQVLAAKAGEANSVVEVQDLVTAGNTALAKIENYNGTTALNVEDYAAAGITGVTTNNLAAVNAQVLAAKAGEANSVGEVQGLVTAGNNALAKIESYDGTTALGLEDYAEAGITGVTAENLAAVNAQVLAAKAGEANSVVEVQGLVTDGNNALAKIENYDGTTALNVEDYAEAGINGVTAENLAAVNAQVLAAKAGEANSVAEVQGLVTAGNNALAKIESYDGTTALGLEDYAEAGITGVTIDNLAAVNAQVLAAKAGEANSVAEIKTLVAAGNAALAKIENYDGTTALGLEDYAAAGITGVTAENLAAVNAQVLAAKTGEANSVAEVQGLVTAGNNALAKIENYDGTNALSVNDYAAAGITGVTAENLAAVNAQVLAAKAGEANSVVEVQDLVTAGNTALAKIENYNGTTALNVEDYAAAGITGVTTDNLAAVNAKVLAANENGANSVPEVQALASTAATAHETARLAISAAAQANDANGTERASLTQYTALGVTGVSDSNLDAINSALNSTNVNESDADSTGEVQAMVSSYNVILSAADGKAGNVGSASPTFADYKAIGVNNVSSTAGASLLSDWVDTKNNTDVDTISKLQAKANDVKVIMDVAALTSSTALEYSTYPALQTALGNLGITGVNNNNVGAVWVAIRDSANSGSDVDARSKLQAMVNAANDQPVVVAGPTASVKLTTNEDNPITFVIQDKLTGLVTDPDVGAAIKGISIHTLTTPITSGAWSYSTDGGVTWSSFPASINSAANFNSALFLNASDQLRFTPTANYNGNGGGIDFRVVDNTFSNTVSGSLVDIAVNGRSGQSMSSGALNFWASITAVNDAPELATGSGITYALPSTPKSGSAPTGQAGTLVSDLIGNHITDADSASAAEGIAITHVDTTRGSLWYSLDGGVNWIHIEGSTTLNAANALLLASDSNNRIYFEPTPGATDETAISAALKFRAWDQTTGAEGNYVDTTATGNTAFSSAEVSVSQAVSPVVIDLNRDGVLSYSQVAMDVDGDGHLDQTAWAGAQDGVLVWDKLGDGKVHDHSQYAFSQYGAAGSTDLQGLATGFDSNQDGELDAKDTRFAEFKVWQDANQNGISDAGEMHNLADVGIACIYLTSDGVRSNPATGVIESGHTTARATDGSSVLVSDAAFAYSALAYSVNGNKLSLLGGDMNLDFSSLAATHKNLAVVDLSGSGANTLKLSLNDVLATATSNGMHKLTLTGDANDTVVMDMADWTKKDATVTEGNHTYAVYNNSGASLFVDEAMKLNIL
ncbi:beta strand repeat-containing protein, partial [Limnohabitans planktonicus]